MTNMDHKYQEMCQRCEVYHSLLDRLRNHAYGYETSLDRILPYRAMFSMEPVGRNYMGVDLFLGKLDFYGSQLSSEANACFSENFSEKDANYMKAMATCILYYLHSECRSADYTFLSFLKITKTFLGEVHDPIQAKNRRTSPFWIMYTDLPEGKRHSHPECIQNAFSILFDDFDYNYASKIANRLQHTVRFFLYDNKLDYMSDRVMNMALKDMILEIVDRLKGIHVNRLPRAGWRSYDGE